MNLQKRDYLWSHLHSNPFIERAGFASREKAWVIGSLTETADHQLLLECLNVALEGLSCWLEAISYGKWIKETDEIQFLAVEAGALAWEEGLLTTNRCACCAAEDLDKGMSTYCNIHGPTGLLIETNRSHRGRKGAASELILHNHQGPWSSQFKNCKFSD